MKRLFAAVLAVLAFAALAACSSGSGSGSSGGSAKLSPGTVGILLSNGSSEVQPKWASTATTALKEIGWNTKVIDAQGNAAEYQQALVSFVNEKVSGILTVGVDAGPVTAGLRQAQQANIPVIAVGVGVNPAGSNLFAASFAPSDAKLGQILAAYLKTKFPGGTQYVVLDLTAAYGAHAPVVAAEPILAAAGFKLVGTSDMNVSDLTGSAQSGAVDLMQAHPQAKVIFSCCDFTAPLTNPALVAAGYKNVLQVVRLDDLSTLNLIRKGADVATAVSDNDRGVLIALDQIIRHAATGDAVNRDADKNAYHYEMVDKSNLPPVGQYVYDPATMIQQYVSQWKSEYDQ